MRSSHHVVICISVVLDNAIFDRSTVKHGTQNIQNDCHQWLSGSFRVHQIRFRPGLCPDPLGELTTLPRTASWFKGTTSNGEGRQRRKGEGREKKGKGGNGRHRSPLCKFLDLPPRGRSKKTTRSWLVNSIMDICSFAH